MYEYLRIIKIAMSISIMLILYLKYSTNKTFKNINLYILLIIISLYNYIFLFHKYLYDIEILRCSFILLNTLLITITSHDFNIRSKNLKFIIGSEIIGILLMISSVSNKMSMSNDFIIFIMFIISVLSYQSILNKKLIIKNIICMMSYLYVTLLYVYKIKSLEFFIFGEVLITLGYIYVYYCLYTRNIMNINQRIKMQSIRIENQSRSINNRRLELELKDQNFNETKLAYTKKNRILNNIINNTNKCIFIIDEYGYITERDQSFNKMWSCNNESRKSINIYNFIEKNIKNKTDFMQTIENISKREKNIIKEFEGFNKYFEIEFTRIEVNDTFLGVICYAEDITYKKSSELKMIENKMRYKKITESIPYDIIVVKNNEVIYKNNESTIIDNKSLNRIISLQNKNKLQKEIIVHNEGREVFYKHISSATFEDKDANSVVIVVKDVTKDKIILDNLKMSQEKYKSLVDILPEGIYTLDMKTNNIVYTNKGLYNIVKDIDEIIRIQDETKYQNFIIKSDNNDEIEFERMKIKDLNNSTIDIEKGSMIINVSDKSKMIGIVRDITSQVEIEEIEVEMKKQKAKKKIRDAFFVNVSHELRTPLNVIDGTNQLLNLQAFKKTNVEERIKLTNEIEEIKKHTNLILDIVNKIIELYELGYEPKNDLGIYNIVSLVENIAEKINHKNTLVIFDTQEEEIMIKINKEHICKIIELTLSMMSNHLKYKSNINVYIKRRGDYVDIEVISKVDNKKSIYQNQGYSIDNDSGLSIVKEAINMYGGSCEVCRLNNNDIKINIKFEIEKNYDYEYDMV